MSKTTTQCIRALIHTRLSHGASFWHPAVAGLRITRLLHCCVRKSGLKAIHAFSHNEILRCYTLRLHRPLNRVSVSSSSFQEE